MTRYSIEPRDCIFVKGYGFLSFPKNMNQNIGKNISKILSGKYSQEFFNYAKQSARDALKPASKKAVQKRAEATGDSTNFRINYKGLKDFTAEKFSDSYNWKRRKIKKYQNKDIYLQKKDNKLSMS